MTPTINYSEWEVKFADSLTTNWSKNWQHDTDADLVNDAAGLTISTNVFIDVVWFKYEIANDFLIAFEWTSLRNGRSMGAIGEGAINQGGKNACVVYLNARGIGDKPTNVLEWASQRSNGDADHYQNQMATLRISYSTPQKTIRFTQSPKEQVLCEPIPDDDFLVDDEPFYIEIQKKGLDILMRITKIRTQEQKTYEVTLKKNLPHGHFAFRQMNKRDVRYRNFRVFYPIVS